MLNTKNISAKEVGFVGLALAIAAIAVAIVWPTEADDSPASTDLVSPASTDLPVGDTEDADAAAMDIRNDPMWEGYAAYNATTEFLWQMDPESSAFLCDAKDKHHATVMDAYTDSMSGLPSLVGVPRDHVAEGVEWAVDDVCMIRFPEHYGLSRPGG